jgi:high affinity Mn2+ porin
LIFWSQTFSAEQLSEDSVAGLQNPMRCARRIDTGECGLLVKFWLVVSTAAVAIVSAQSATADDIMVTKAPAIPYSDPAAYNWTGFYAGGSMGVGWGESNWNAGPGISGSTDLFQTIDTFDEAGSFFAGVQAGYNYVLPNRILLGAEVDASFPAFRSLPSGVNPFGVSVGGISTFTSPTLGPVSFAETVLASGTARARIGYAPAHWLFYASGGFAWTYNQQSLTQIATGNTDKPFLWRLGWAAGAGIEVPIAPHWAARFEYLHTGYGNHNTPFFVGAQQPIISDFSVQEVRAGVDYMFDNGAAFSGASLVFKGPATPAQDNLSFHGQTTFVWQGYPAFRSPYEGANSLPGGGEGRETFDTTLFAGARLWQGAELWIDPEIDQGRGLADTHGVAGFTSGESYKLGFDYPYARVQRFFVRQTIDLGGETAKVEDGANQFAGSQRENRLVLTVGKFYPIDIFDTNKYANNPKSDFLNWSVINAGTFDFAGDAWSVTYGAAAEWYQGNWTLRGGVFDLSQTPSGGGGDSALSYGLDPTFDQFEFVGEFEQRYALWGQPGKIKVTGYLERGRMGSFQDALNLSAATGLDPSDALAAVRTYQSRPGVSLNMEQQITETAGVFARAGWADGNVEPWDNTDIDRTVSAGVSLSGKQWSRPDDTIGVAGVINGLAPVHAAYFAAGGTGIVIGDGALNYGLEQIVETYYSYAISSSTKISFDYQFIANPGYNADRGPVNVFAGRFHTEF